MRIPRTAMGAVAAVLLMTDIASAQGKSTTSQGSTPNGKPFESIQSQIASLQGQINAVESTLQSQIDALKTRVTVVESQVTSLDGAVAALNDRVGANESAIAATQTAITALQAQLAAAQAAIASNSGDISALQSLAASLQATINAHQTQLNQLTAASSYLQNFVANLANYDCTYGQVVNGVQGNGAVQCVTGGSAGGNLLTTTSWSTGYYSAYAQCPTGYQVTGGGYYYYDYYGYYYYYGYYGQMGVTNNYPSGNGWYVAANGGYSPYVQASAVCARTQ